MISDKKFRNKLNVMDIVMYTDEEGTVYYGKVESVYYDLNEIDVYNLNENNVRVTIGREHVVEIYQTV